MEPVPPTAVRSLGVRRGGVDLAVTDAGGEGPPVLLLHGLAGSSRELLETAAALTDSHHVLLLDQRGHGGSTRHPRDVSRQAFVDDVVAVAHHVLPGQALTLVGQSMGAHTAFLVAAQRPDLVAGLVLLEGHPAGGATASDAHTLGRYLASWPVPFPDEATALDFLGESPLARAWVADLEHTPAGLRPRFAADVMEQVMIGLVEPRWREWEALSVPTLAVYGDQGLFTADQVDDVFRRRPATQRADLVGAGHDAHLDALQAWIAVLRGFLRGSPRGSAT